MLWPFPPSISKHTTHRRDCWKISLSDTALSSRKRTLLSGSGGKQCYFLLYFTLSELVTKYYNVGPGCEPSYRLGWRCTVEGWRWGWSLSMLLTAPFSPLQKRPRTRIVTFETQQTQSSKKFLSPVINFPNIIQTALHKTHKQANTRTKRPILCLYECSL